MSARLGRRGRLGPPALLLAVFTLPACPRERAVGHLRPLPDGAPVVDPVTGRRCAKDPDTESAVAWDRTFYFCDPASRVAFAREPLRFGQPTDGFLP